MCQAASGCKYIQLSVDVTTAVRPAAIKTTSITIDLEYLSCPFPRPGAKEYHRESIFWATRFWQSFRKDSISS